MNKAELIEEVQKQLGGDATRKNAEQAVNAVLQAIRSGIIDDAKAQIVGFGTFTVKDRAAREGRNPKTGDKMIIPASRIVSFKPAAGLKESC